MKEFIMILFFSDMVLLTPTPVDIAEVLMLEPIPPVEAITSGASIQLDVTNMLNGPSFREQGIVEVRDSVRKMFNAGSIYVELYPQGGGATVVLDEISISLSNEDVRLILSSRSGVPINVNFSKIVVHSDHVINNANLYWKNYKW